MFPKGRTGIWNPRADGTRPPTSNEWVGSSEPRGATAPTRPRETGHDTASNKRPSPDRTTEHALT